MYFAIATLSAQNRAGLPDSFDVLDVINRVNRMLYHGFVAFITNIIPR